MGLILESNWMSTRLLFVTLLLASTAAPAVCHEGHDHSTPSGNWPAHKPTDSTAGGASFLMWNVQSSVWKLSDGTTGNSPDPTTNVADVGGDFDGDGSLDCAT